MININTFGRAIVAQHPAYMGKPDFSKTTFFIEILHVNCMCQ